MSKKFKRKVLIGFGSSLTLLLISTAASYISIRGLIESKWWVDHTNKVITRLDATNEKLLEAESGQRGFLLSQQPVFLNPYDSIKAAARADITAIKALTQDKPEQQERARLLDSAVSRRFRALDAGIRIRSNGKVISDTQLLRGKNYTSDVQTIIGNMKSREKYFLSERTKELEKYADITPLFIILAALIALSTAVIFGTRLIADFKKRVLLQQELERKDAEIKQRLVLIQGIADKISQGNYKIRLGDEGKDVLGSLAGSLNKMAQSLDYSFCLLSEKEWMQTAIAALNMKMLGDQDLTNLMAVLLEHLVQISGSHVGAIYLADDHHTLKIAARFALSAGVDKEIVIGQGIVGECAAQKKLIRVQGIPPGNFVLSLSSGNVKPSEVVAAPLIKDGRLLGVVELGTVGKYTDNHIEFVATASEHIATGVQTTVSRLRLQELLEETQSQAEELQAQHSELENMNEELKLQSQRLQVSEEELKVQQEELMQTNTELEERTNLLEERNQMIEERNQEIQLKARELEITTKYKSEFLANMSHELRTPLNSILLLSRLLLENNEHNLSKDQLESSEVILTSGQGLLTLIDDILDLSKIEAGKMDVEVAEINILETANDLRALFAPVARHKGIDFVIDISPDAPTQIETDKMRLQQILKNLISNGLKFTTKGSVRMEVRPVGEAKLAFQVRDTGIGIPEDKQQLIFEAFQQADGSTRRQYGGTGLGLSISRELTRLLGGKIELESTPGAGSVFKLILPRTATYQVGFEEAGAQERISESKEAHTEETFITEDDTADKMNEVFQRIEHGLKNEPRKVLIVEENSKHAKALCYFLENFTIITEIKTDIDGAITTLRDVEGACVILDSGLHGDALHSALERVKSTPGLELLPIILFTGKNLSKMEEGRIKQYANSVVLKTAHSYQRILDEVSLYLHLVEANRPRNSGQLQYKKLGRLTEVLKDKKVLVADDDVRNIFSLSKALESAGMNIISAIDGKEALQQLKQDPTIDVVLMDMMMPELDGYETMQEIRKMPRFSKLPIIAVTAKAMTGDREKCISAGASDYITKPIDKDQLLSLLRVWLYDRN